MNTRIEKDREYKDRKVMNTRIEKVENTRIEKGLKNTRIEK